MTQSIQFTATYCHKTARQSEEWHAEILQRLGCDLAAIWLRRSIKGPTFQDVCNTRSVAPQVQRFVHALIDATFNATSNATDGDL
ncbi:MAG: hypothetical protein MUC43_04980 [Pirellula sp.]|nr:hypothetical protein [Pirellula sp.]